MSFQEHVTDFPVAAADIQGGGEEEGLARGRGFSEKGIHSSSCASHGGFLCSFEVY